MKYLYRTFNYSRESRFVLLLLFFTYLFNHTLVAQTVNVTTVVTPPYSIYVDDVVKFNYNTIVTLTNISSQTERLKLNATLEGDNGVKIIMKKSFTPAMAINLPGHGNRVFTGNDLRRIFSNLTRSDLILKGVNERVIAQTNKLPEGVYQLCIKALDYTTGELKSFETSGCASFVITDYDPPVITHPMNAHSVTPLKPQSLMINWTPSGVAQYTKYKLEMVDMTLNALMDPNDAFNNVGIILLYQKKGIIQNSFYYDMTKPHLIKNHSYAVRVTAYDPTHHIAFKNEGKSEVISFVYKKKNPIDKPNKKLKGNYNTRQYVMNACQNLNAPSDKTPVKDVKEYDVLKIGDHDLKVFNLSWAGNKLSGEGKIINSYFKVPILVTFSELLVNKAHQVISGTAVARNDNNVPSEWINELGDVDFGGEDVSNLITNLMNGGNDRIIEYPYSNLDSVGLGMPLGINRHIGGADQLVAIVGMQFGALGAGLNAVAEIEFPSYNQSLQLGASAVCFDKNGFSKDAFLQLVKDYTINKDGKIKIKMKKGENGDPPTGTHIVMEDKGFKQAQLEGEIKIDKESVKPVEGSKDEEGNPVTEVTGKFKVTVENPSNFMVLIHF